jgi:uncharacterized membrane protein required for colicin V production
MRGFIAMNGLDAICLALVTVCGLKGFFHGFWMEFIDLLCTIAAFFGTVMLARSISDWFSQKFPLLAALSTLICFFSVYFILINILRVTVNWIRSRDRIPFLRRVWGAGVGFLRGVLYAGIFSFFALQFKPIDKPHWRKSDAVLVKPFSSVAGAVYRLAVSAVPETGSVLVKLYEPIRTWVRPDSTLPPS